MLKIFTQIYKALFSIIAWILSIVCSYLIIQFVALVLILVTSIVSLFAFFPILVGIGIYLTTGIWQLSIIIASIIFLPLFLLNSYRLLAYIAEICKKHSSKFQRIKQEPEQDDEEIKEEDYMPNDIGFFICLILGLSFPSIFIIQMLFS